MIRVPWPWEQAPAERPAAARRLLEAWREQAARSYPEVPLPQTHSVTGGGELAGVRDTTALMERRILDMTDHSPAAREWAARKARIARDSYHDRVMSGALPPPRKR